METSEDVHTKSPTDILERIQAASVFPLFALSPSSACVLLEIYRNACQPVSIRRARFSLSRERRVSATRLVYMHTRMPTIYVLDE